MSAHGARSRSSVPPARSPPASGATYVVPDDVKRLALAVLEHRLLLAPDAELRGVTPGDVVRELLGSVPVPGATG